MIIKLKELKHLVVYYNDRHFQSRFRTLGKLLHTIVEDWSDRELDIKSLFDNMLKTLLISLDDDNNNKRLLSEYLTKDCTLLINDDALQYLNNCNYNSYNINQELESILYIDFTIPLTNQQLII
jgi:uncharacterized protein YutD